MVARLCAFVIWALVAATAVFWGLRLLVRAPSAPAYAVAVGDASAVRADLSRVLGSAPVTASAAAVTLSPEVSSRFKLLGIMAPKGKAEPAVPGSGVALIAVDGKPPKAYVVGSALDGDLVLQSVSLRTASIGPAQGAASVKLELPALAPAATGTLPAAGATTSSSTGSTNPAVPPMPAPVPPRPGLPPSMPPAQAIPAQPAVMPDAPIQPAPAVVQPGPTR